MGKVEKTGYAQKIKYARLVLKSNLAYLIEYSGAGYGT